MTGDRRGLLGWALHELGISTVVAAPRDTKLLIVQRAVRLMAYGGSTLILVSHLTSMGASESQTGLFLTLTLVGDTLLSLVLTVCADALGRRAVLAGGAVLMACSGAVFALSTSWPLLLAAAVLGVISPSGNEIGPFRAVEESVLAQLTVPDQRGPVYAWYSLFGTAAAAVGMAAAGWTVHLLQTVRGWEDTWAFRAVFAAYGVLGLVKLLLTLLLSAGVEEPGRQQQRESRAAVTPVEAGTAVPATEDEDETEPLLNGRDRRAGGTFTSPPPERKGLRSLLPDISRESAGTVATLAVLFALDSFASGLAALSWVAKFFESRYSLEFSTLGSVFFTTSIIAALSMLVASSLARRFGNVNTMVFTHLPSAVFLALVPVPSLPLSLLFLVLRSCTQSMDVAPRAAFMAAVVLPHERTAVMGFLNMVKTLAQSLGPLVTGALADHGAFWVSLVAAGTFKASYDIGLLVLFKNHESERMEAERLLDDGDAVVDENDSVDVLGGSDRQTNGTESGPQGSTLPRAG